MAFFVDPFGWGGGMGPAGLFGAAAGAPRFYADAPGAFCYPGPRGSYVQPGRQQQQQQSAGRRPAANPLSAFYAYPGGVMLRGAGGPHQQHPHAHYHHHPEEAFYDASSEAEDTDSEYSDEEQEEEAAFAPAPPTPAAARHQARPARGSSPAAAAAHATSTSGGSSRSSGSGWGCAPVHPNMWAAAPGSLHAPATARHGPFAAAKCASDAPCYHKQQQQQQQQQRRANNTRQQPAGRHQQQPQRPVVHTPEPPAPAPAANKGAARQILVRAAVNGTQQQPKPPSQPVPQRMPPAKTGAPSRAARPARQLTPAQAATVIQSMWRMRRLAQQHDALTGLIAASTALRDVEARFADAKGRASHEAAAALPRPAIAHPDYLVLNELTMRVLLQLDGTPCGVDELRAVRKRLAANAMALLDRVQQAFNTGVTASMELPAVKPATAAAPPQQQQHEEEEGAEEADGSDCAASVVVRLVYPGKMCEAGTQTD